MKPSSVLLCLLLTLSGVAQVSLPADYLTPAFHAGRREALRAVMPPRSVAVIFSYPSRNFSNDVEFPYHPNPDLYYFSSPASPTTYATTFPIPPICTTLSGSLRKRQPVLADPAAIGGCREALPAEKRGRQYGPAASTVTE